MENLDLNVVGGAVVVWDRIRDSIIVVAFERSALH